MNCLNERNIMDSKKYIKTALDIYKQHDYPEASISFCPCESTALFMLSPNGPHSPGLIPELRRPSGGDKGNTFQYFCLENPMDRGAW